MTDRIPSEVRANSTARVLFASLAGTTIEFFDFYIYATAAVIVFPKLFFPASDATSATLNSLATFALAFFARPLGSAIFGHFGDRIGRKATLVAALLTMGLSTVIIGLLPTYQTIGVAAPALLAACRFGQGLGLGGEWGGAVLLATENAPPGRRAWFGMFPQLGAPLGYILSAATFLILSAILTDAQFFAFGWRIPFLISTVLVLVGLYVRLKLTETPAFLRAIANNERVKLPMGDVFARQTSALVLGTFAAVVAFVLFYLMTVFALSWATNALHYERSSFLVQQMISALMFAIGIPIASIASDHYGARVVSMAVAAMIFVFGLVFAPLFTLGVGPFPFLAIGLLLIGFTYGPLGTALAQMFPTAVRYTGSSLAFNFAGILGASLAPYVATWLAKTYGLQFVGYYLSAAALISLIAFYFTRDAE
jgi:metabolite-proton symporter